MKKHASHHITTWVGIGLLLLLTVTTTQAQRHVAIKTNLLHAATATPNFGIEFAVHPRLTVDLWGAYNLVDFKGNTSLRHYLFQPELRYWFCRTFEGHFAGVHALVGRFDIGGVSFIKSLKNYHYRGPLFGYDHMAPEEMCRTLAANVHSANIPCMVVTMGGEGAVYARSNGESGVVPAKKVDVIDTTGAGDAFFAGTVIGLTYGKNLPASCEIGSRLAASVISITENVCPRFRPLEFGLDIPVLD